MLQNPWIGYLSRSYQQIKADVFAQMGTQAPELTDLGESAEQIKLLSAWAAFIEMTHYYLDNVAREKFIQECRIFSDAVLIANAYDYRIKGAIPATVNITFTLNKPAASTITIPSGTQVNTSSGIPYFTTEDGVILSTQSSVTVGAIQQAVKTPFVIATGDGTINQEYEISDTQIVDGSVAVTINSAGWTPKDTFFGSLPTDTVFVAGIDTNGLMQITGGDNITGMAFPAAQTITVGYNITQGSAGNVAAQLITTIVSSLTLPSTYTVSATNTIGASGGTDIENLITLSKNIPLSLRTLERAVTFFDYIAVLQMAPGVALAGVVYNCGKLVEGYIAPVGGGIANLTLIGTTQTYINARKMITTQVVVNAAGEVHVVLGIALYIKSNYVAADASARVSAALRAFLSVTNQTIGGSTNPDGTPTGRVFLSDLYNIIDSDEGVEHSKINVFTTVPYAFPVSPAIPLVWNPAILAGSLATNNWTIVFTSSTGYQVLKNKAYVGSFNVGDVAGFSEVTWIVNSASYLTGYSYTFITYPYDNTIARELVLSEPSVPQSDSGDITIITYGGI